jgi:hypothetical protein
MPNRQRLLVPLVLALQAARRHHDGRIGNVRPIGFDRTVGLGAFGRRRQGLGTYQGSRDYRRQFSNRIRLNRVATGP